MAEAGQSVAKLLIFMKRRPGMSVPEFRAYYEERHVPLCMAHMAGPTRYVRRYLDQPDDGEELPYDVITELWFPDAAMRDAVARAFARDAMPPEVIADELQLFDRSKARAVAVSECETML